jgi:hypothetical protein
MDKLDREEREILAAYQEAKLERVALSAEEIERYRQAARAATAEQERRER